MDKKFYCIYTGDFVLNEKGSLEHIIPLGLGGADSFSITVERDSNSF